MGDVLGYDPARARNRTPAVRAGRWSDGWFVERLAGCAVVSRVPAWHRAQAELEASRIAREEGIALLMPRLSSTAADAGADLHGEDD